MINTRSQSKARALITRSCCSLVLAAITAISVSTNASGGEPPPRRAPVSGLLIALYASADQALKANSLEAAEDAYKRLVEAAPGLARAWLGLGDVRQRRGKSSEALAAYEQVLRLAAIDVNDPDLRQLAAKTHYNRALLRLTDAQKDLEAIDGDALTTNLRDHRQEITGSLALLLQDRTASSGRQRQSEPGAPKEGGPPTPKSEREVSAVATATATVTEYGQGRRVERKRGADDLVIIRGGAEPPRHTPYDGERHD